MDELSIMSFYRPRLKFMVFIYSLYLQYAEMSMIETAIVDCVCVFRRSKCHTGEHGLPAWSGGRRTCPVSGGGWGQGESGLSPWYRHPSPQQTQGILQDGAPAWVGCLCLCELSIIYITCTYGPKHWDLFSTLCHLGFML